MSLLLILNPYLMIKFWTNLAYIKRNQVLVASNLPKTGAYSNELSQAIRLLARSSNVEPCNVLGFFASSVTVCAEVELWRQEVNYLVDFGQPMFFAPQPLNDIKYGEILSLILPEQEFINIDSFTLMTLMGNSTRITQGELVAYVFIITKEQDVYLVPLRAGLETAEGTYDSPDVPPQHSKPFSYPRSGGGDAYPISLKFERPVSPKIVTIIFLYAQHWHVKPSLMVWAVSPNRIDNLSPLFEIMVPQ